MEVIGNAEVRARPGHPIFCDTCSKRADRLTLQIWGTEQNPEYVYVCDACLRKKAKAHR